MSATKFHTHLIGIINKPLLLHLVGCLYYSLTHGSFTTTLPSRPNLRFFFVELLLLPELADAPLSFFQRISISQSIFLLTHYTPHPPQNQTSPRTELRTRVAACYEAAINLHALCLQTTYIQDSNHTVP